MGRIKAIELIIALIIVGTSFSFQIAPAWAKVDPYSYKPRLMNTGYRGKKLRPPARMKSVAPSPKIIKDSDGNVIVYRKDRTKKGEPLTMGALIDISGNTTYYMGDVKRFEKDWEGSITRRYEYHSPLAAVSDEFGEIIGYEDYGLGGLLLAEYDANRVLLRRREYEGRNLNWITDELTKSRTKYGKYGREYTLDATGNLTGYAIGDGDGSLKWWVEKTVDEFGNLVDGNRTFFGEFAGEALYTEDRFGNRITTTKWENHRRVSQTDQYGNVKIFGKYGVTEERDTDDNLLISHTWDGTRHVSSINPGTGEIAYYKIGDFSSSDSYKIDYVKSRTGIKVQDYVDLYEVVDKTVEEIQVFLNITEEDAGIVVAVIQDLVNRGKSLSGLAVVAYFDSVLVSDGGDAVYASKLDLYDEYNKIVHSVVLDDPTL